MKTSDHKNLESIIQALNDIGSCLSCIDKMPYAAEVAEQEIEEKKELIHHLVSCLSANFKSDHEKLIADCHENLILSWYRISETIGNLIN